MPMKKFLYITAVILFFVSCKGKDSFIIEGKITGLQSTSMYFAVPDLDGGMKVDTITADVDGHFKYSGSSDLQIPVVLYLEDGNVWTTVWVQNNDKLSMSGDVNYPELIIARGNDVNDLLADFKEENKSLLKEKRKLTDQQSSDIEENDSLDAKMNHSEDYESKILNINHQLKAKARKFIDTNPASIASVVLIQDYLMEENNPKQTQDYLSKITGDVVQSNLYQKLVRVNDKLLLTEPGENAPDFMVLDADGDSIRLESYSGKYFLLTFAASWCETCEKDNEELASLHKEMKQDQFEMLTISLDEDSAAWRTVVKDKKLVWNQVVDTDGWSSDMVSLYNITEIPSNILINKESIIVGRNLPTDSIKKVVK